MQNAKSTSAAGVRLSCSSLKVNVLNSRGWEGWYHMLVTNITLNFLDHVMFCAMCVLGPHPISPQISNENYKMPLEHTEYLPLTQAGLAAFPLGCPGGCLLTWVELCMRWGCPLRVLRFWLQAFPWHGIKAHVNQKDVEIVYV